MRRRLTSVEICAGAGGQAPAWNEATVSARRTRGDRERSLPNVAEEQAFMERNRGVTYARFSGTPFGV